jgi:hypothetical protein
MPTALVGSAIGAGGSILGGLFNKTSNTSKVDNTTNTTAHQQQMQTEDPNWTSFRNSLLPQIQGEINKAQKPLYGDPEKANYLSDLNELAKHSMNSIRGNLARSGGLGSGREQSSLNSLFGQRMGQASQFFSQLPQMNENARRTGVGGLLSLAANVAGPNLRGTTGDSEQSVHQFGTVANTQTGAGVGAGLGGMLGMFGAGIANGKIPNPFSSNGLNQPHA